MQHARDLEVIAAWNVAIVVTLVEAHGMSALGMLGIGAEVRRRPMQWAHWPTGDYQVPTWCSKRRGRRGWLACGHSSPAAAGR